jgi:hypothetical protein
LALLLEFGAVEVLPGLVYGQQLADEFGGPGGHFRLSEAQPFAERLRAAEVEVPSQGAGLFEVAAAASETLDGDAEFFGSVSGAA